jgi:hypothetical protein
VNRRSNSFYHLQIINAVVRRRAGEAGTGDSRQSNENRIIRLAEARAAQRARKFVYTIQRTRRGTGFDKLCGHWVEFPSATVFGTT